MMNSDKKPVKVINQAGPIGFTLFLAFIGAAIYFEQQASGFWEVILALLKAIVWPVFVMYNVLHLLNV